MSQSVHRHAIKTDTYARKTQHDSLLQAYEDLMLRAADRIERVQDTHHELIALALAGALAAWSAVAVALHLLS